MTRNTKSQYDVIIIGAGHNGLICACYLAKVGRRVLVLEANSHTGGASATDEFSPGFKVSSCAQWLMQLSPEVVSELSLHQHGLEYSVTNLETILLDQNSKIVRLKADHVSGIGVSEKDQWAYKKFYKQMSRFTKIVEKAFNQRPPKLVESDFHDKLNLLNLGLNLKLLGKEDMQQLMRIMLMNIYDLLEEEFDHPLIKSALSMDAILGSKMGPRSPNTVFGYLYRHLGKRFGFKGPSLVKGGMGALGDVLAKAAIQLGVEIRTHSKVSKINLNASTAVSVEVIKLGSESIKSTLTPIKKSTEQIFAKTIVSNVDPKTTFERLVGYPQVETGVARNVHNIRSMGCTAKLHLALIALPDFKGVEQKDLGNRLLIAPSMDAIERSFNHAKYGEYSEHPVMDISIPTIHDQSLASNGKHVLSAIVQFAPYDLKAGWSAKTKKAFLKICMTTLEQYAPGISQLIIESELLTPVDIEQRFRMFGGHWHHGELALDQVMMMRPFFDASQYSTPVKGLFLCGAGTHPGGNVTGLCGRNAAREIIRGGH